MKYKKLLGLILFVSISAYAPNPAIAQQEVVFVERNYAQDAALIRANYEENAHKLSRFKSGHMGLRFYRHYGDEKYIPLFIKGIELAGEGLNRIYKDGLTAEDVKRVSTESNKKYYSTSTTRKRLRSKTLEEFPNYRFYATKLLRHVARLDEVGLRHERHEEFVVALRSYDFERAFTDEKMIKAWGAQLANQVYWLKQLGIADHSKVFLEAVEKVYPAEKDRQLSKQQFENKLYTLTHIVIGASGYYQVEVSDFPHITDYFRRNVSVILNRAKEDVVIEVGISLLLTGKDYPATEKIRKYISQSINRDKRMIPSPSGKTDFASGEHRNIIGVLLLDWQGVHQRPNAEDHFKWRSSIPPYLYTFKTISKKRS